MKADTRDQDLERKLRTIEAKVRSPGTDPSIWRRAGRISRVKIYFLSRRRIRIPGRLRALPFEGKVILSFILSLFALSVPASFQHAQSSSPVVTLFKLLIGVADFMVTMVPLIIAIICIYLIFAILCHLAKNYVA